MSQPWREAFRGSQKLTDFYVHLAAKSERTHIAYENRLKQICDFFGIPYVKFDPQAVTQEMYDTLFKEKSQKAKHSTLNSFTSVFSVLSKVYNLGLDVYFLIEDDAESDYVTFRELQEIINKTDKEVATLCSFLFCTGLRLVSVSKIKKEDLFLNSENPFVKNVYLKGGRYEDFYILFPEICLPLLKWYMQYKSQQLSNYSENPFVFVSAQGHNTRQYIYFNVSKAGKVLGRAVSPKMFRTGLAVYLKQMGVQGPVIQMALGHRDLNTTVKVYSKFDKSDILRELNMKKKEGLVGSNSGINTFSTFNSNTVQTVTQNIEKCPFCSGVIDHEMLVCPHCLRDIRRICPVCKRFLNIKWEICPYCKKKFDDEFIKAKTRDDV
ncbi:MAG: hypothetical protein AYK18_14910 [Theionarchaea archaeon DG-70]|nr:MAG: hypothetical protein AYK18_14910 [Theionarchaea archaeon DG-70]